MYYGIVDSACGGIRHHFGTTAVRVPAEYSRIWATRQTHYELPAVSRFERWCLAHPTGLVLDIGCEIGQYALAALHLLKGGRVIAFDSALSSLQILRRSSWTAGSANRLQLVRGFVTDVGQGQQLEAVAEEAETALASADRTSDLDYVNMDHSGTGSIPLNALDDLFRGGFPAGPCLIKMDIEGAEAKALRGAEALLAATRPQLLLSIHPQYLTNFGSSKDEVISFLHAHNYSTELLCVDHEEHWWCKPL